MGGESVANVLFIASNVSFIAAAICGITAVILFFRFKIPSVISDLSGRSARKSIEQMRLQNEKKGSKSHRSNKEKKKKEQKKVNADADSARPETGLIAENRKNDAPSETTALLNDEEATGYLDQNETAPLGSTEKVQIEPAASVKLEMLDNVMIVHSEETID